MANYKKLVLLLCTFLMQFFADAQKTGARLTANNDGFMRSEGKIYVVMAVALIVLGGLILYIVRLDRKITKLEKGENF